MTAPSGARVAIGRVTKAHGLRGEVVVSGTPLTADEVRGLGELFARDAAGDVRRLAVRDVRPFLQQLLVQFEGVGDRDAAAALAGRVLEVDPARLPPAGEGTVYLFELIGLAVETEAGEALGRVREVLRTGATPVLAVDGPATADGRPRERLLPMSAEVVVRLERAAGRLVVRLLPGMEDL